MSIMGFIVRIYNINFENDFTVSYIQTNSLTDLNSGFIVYDTFPSSTTTVEIPDLEFNTKYWVKLVDNVNGKTIVKNIFTHDSKYFDCYDQIDFRVELDGNFCNLDGNGINVTVTLYDNIEPNGNNSSEVGGIPNTYTLYRGDDINSIFTDTMTLMGTFTTDPITKIIHEYTETNEVDYYLFLVHGDGFNVTNINQGGFMVRKIKIENKKREPNEPHYNIAVATASLSYKGVSTANRYVVINSNGDVPSFYNRSGSTSGGISITSLYVAQNKNIFISGNFTYNGLANTEIIHLRANGRAIDFFNFGSKFNFNSQNQPVNQVLQQSDGKYIMVGSFTRYDNVIVSRRVRLLSDFTIDPTFENEITINSSIRTAAVQNDDKILYFGDFTTIGLTTFNRGARVNTDGTIDPTFDVLGGFNGSVFNCEIQSDGKILVCGAFTTFNGEIVNRIVRLNSDGSRDLTFNTGTGFNLTVNFVKVTTDNKILVGGAFTTFNDEAVNRLVRLNSDGSRDLTFNIGTGFNTTVNDALTLPNGKIVVGGGFTQFNGSLERRGILILNDDGSLDETFIGSSVNFIVSKIALLN